MTGDEATAADARNRAADALARAQNIPIDQARSQVQRYEQDYRSAVDLAKQKAIETAAIATTALATASIFAFISLAIGAIAAWIGGVAGTKKDAVVIGEYGDVRP